MKKKLVSTMLVASMAAGILAGCGSSAAPAQEAAPAAEAAVEEAAPAAEEAAPAEEAAVEEAAPAAETPADPFYIYSWNTELGERLEYVFDAYPDIKERVVYVNVGDSGVYQEKIDQLLQQPDSEDYPDMIAFEAAYIMKYTNSDYTLSIEDCGLTEADLSEMYPYTIEVARDKRNGAIKGTSWQSCPGSFMYRADLAEKYLGVTSPEEMQAKISTWEDFIATAKELKEASNDECRILSSNSDTSNVFYSNKSEPWVDDNRVFHMDDQMVQYLEVVKELEQGDLTNKTSPWTDGWNAGAANDDTFGYFGCTWFLHWTIKANCGGSEVGEGTYGLWKMCQGPAPYYWGGTWLGATKDCSDPELAGRIMKALCCDTEIMQKMSEETLDYVNNKTAMQNLSDAGKGAYDFLGGQDFIEVFMPLAENVDVSYMSAYDQTINNLLDTQVTEYAHGNKDLDAAIADFKAAVHEQYPDITVE